MSKTISILLVLSAAVSFAVDEWGFETVSLDLLPEDAEVQALELVEKWRVTVYPDENITIGEPIRLYAPDFQERGICVPVALDHEGTLTIADGVEANRQHREALNDLREYKASLNWFSDEGEEAKEKAYNGEDEEYNELKKRKSSTWLLNDSYYYIVIAFSGDMSFIAGMNNPYSFSTVREENTSVEGESGVLVGYGFHSEFNDQIGILGVYETKEGKRFVRTNQSCWDPKYITEFFYLKHDVEDFQIFHKVFKHLEQVSSVRDDRGVDFNTDWEVNQVWRDCFLATFCMRCIRQLEGPVSFNFTGGFPDVDWSYDDDEYPDKYESYYQEDFFDYVDGTVMPGNIYGDNGCLSFTEATVYGEVGSDLQEDFLYNFASIAGPTIEWSYDGVNYSYESFYIDGDLLGSPGQPKDWAEVKTDFVNALDKDLLQIIAYDYVGNGGFHAVLITDISSSDWVTFRNPWGSRDGGESVSWSSIESSAIDAILGGYNVQNDDLYIVSSEEMEDGQVLSWLPYRGFPVRGYTILSRDEAGQITQLSGVIRANDDGGWHHFETKAEGELGVRYYPIGNGEPVDIYAGEEVYFE